MSKDRGRQALNLNASATLSRSPRVLPSPTCQTLGFYINSLAREKPPAIVRILTRGSSISKTDLAMSTKQAKLAIAQAFVERPDLAAGLVQILGTATRARSGSLG